MFCQTLAHIGTIYNKTLDTDLRLHHAIEMSRHLDSVMVGLDQARWIEVFRLGIQDS